MKLEFWLVGNTAFDYLKERMDIYEKRLKHFIPFESRIIPDIKGAKNMREAQIKQKEGEKILEKLEQGDFLMLLDERGKQFDSLVFADKLEQQFQLSHKRIIYLIGGAYGFSDEVYARANGRWSLSKLTFSHQMVRLFVLEQLYRAISIQRGLPYHHA